jgi:RHS repeat-associated protein
MVAFAKPHRKVHTPDRSAKDSGLRYYSPEISRWLSRDPLGLGGGLNLYGFVANNPLTKNDSLGRWWWDDKCQPAGLHKNCVVGETRITSQVSAPWALAIAGNTATLYSLSGANSIPSTIGALLTLPIPNLLDVYVESVSVLGGSYSGWSVWTRVQRETCLFESCCLFWIRLDWKVQCKASDNDEFWCWTKCQRGDGGPTYPDWFSNLQDAIEAIDECQADAVQALCP